MALLSFPPNPNNGEQYPPAPLSGQNVYVWDGTDLTWRLSGTATGVVAGTYGTPVAVPKITIDATGRITYAIDEGIQLGDTTQVGLVQLTDSTSVDDNTTALTAAQGYKLQREIGDVSTLSPIYSNLVDAINAINSPTGVIVGTYGSSTTVGRFTVNSQGRITAASNVSLAVATTSATGVVRVGANLNITGAGVLSVPTATTTTPGATQLVNNTTTNDPTKALTAAQGFALQQEINSRGFLFLDDISSSFNGSTVSFTLSIGGNLFAPFPSTNLLVFIGAVLQTPGVSYTVSSATINFFEAPPADATFVAVTIG